MLAKILEFVKARFDAILIAVIFILVILCSFAAGYIIAKWGDREPITINQAVISE